MNSCMVAGVVAEAPALIETARGASLRFRVRVDEDSGGQIFDVRVFGTLARLAAEELRRGVLVAVQGRALVTRWSDDEDRPQASFEVLAHRVVPLRRGEVRKP